MKAKIKAVLSHKHEWQEDKWGKRCQICGRIRTKKAERYNKQLTAGLSWFLWVMQLGLSISMVILIIKYPLQERAIERVRDQLLLILGPHYWTLFYFFMAVGCMVLRHLLLKGVPERPC